MTTSATTSALENAAEAGVSAVKNLTWVSAAKIGVLIVVLLILVRLLSRLAEKLLLRSKIDRSLHGFLRTTFKIVLYFIATTIVASSLNVDVTSLIAVLSVAGLALSLALQGSLSNLASGIVILTTKPFHVDDYVKIGDGEGTVKEIRMSYTVISTYDQRIIYIPNSTVTSSEVVNYTVGGKRRVDLTISVGYENDLDAVRQAIVDTAKGIPAILQDEPFFARVSAYGDSTVAFTMRAWTQNQDYWDTYYDLLEGVKKTFDARGITMSYPHMHLHFDGAPPAAQEKISN